MRPRAAVLASFLSCLALWLTACSTTRTSPARSAEQRVPPSEAREPVTPPALPPVEVVPPPKVSPPPLPCVCSELAPKPHVQHKAKPKEPVQEPEPAGPAPPPANAVIDAQVGRMEGPLTSILGRNVQSPKGEDLGRVVDLLSDPEGRVRVAIIDFGGFLGVGTRRIAVDWPLLHFRPEDKNKPLVLTVTRQKLQSAPEYKDASNPRVLMPPAAVSDEPGAGAQK
jgi:hypothetical protein